MLIPPVSMPGKSAQARAAQGQPGDAAKEMMRVERWLLLGPIPTPLPAFNQELDDQRGAKDLLAYGHLFQEKLVPSAGSKIKLIGSGEAAWTVASAGDDGLSIAAEGSKPQIAYLAAYVETPRWMKVDLEARCTTPFEMLMGGKASLKQDGFSDMSGEPKKGEVKLEEGKHLILVKTVYVPSDTAADWRLDLRLSPSQGLEGTPVLSVDPSRPMNMTDVLDAPYVGRVDVSPDGSRYAVWISERTPPEGDTEERIEVRQARTGRLIRVFKDIAKAGSWSWTPSGDGLSYVTSEDGAGTLRIADVETGETETVLKDVEDLGGYRWSPDGSYIAYFVDKDYEPDDSGIKRLRGAYDRRDYERDKSFLHLTSVPGGMTRELTTGDYTTHIYDIHPDGDRILGGRSYEDLTVRPYEVSEIVVIDVGDQTTEILHRGPWIRGAIWSPDGDEILVTGGPSAFGEIGVNVPEGVTPNEYDTQAYIFDPRTKDIEAITVDFAPSIEAAFWPEPGGNIYFVVEETEYRRLYRYNVRAESFRRIDLPCDVIHSADVAEERAIAMCRCSSADRPMRLYGVDLTTGRYQMSLYPAADHFESVRIGDVEDWNFTAASGREIVGRVHYPPDFDPAKTYPCIVYYYGGTSPVIRSFGGRYPKNLWAAMGYVVYVLQPSGATGFGQEFSAAHVNDWGETTTGEIIEGVGKFLNAHPFVDPGRVGCIGASYGGFMTQLLLTRTNIFAAGVSHAGISALTSYWGEGYWGYLYSAAATANSFPWNRPDIYVHHSPIYAADKIDTPLLLLHGASDTNVPPGESEQMYTALKLLGKEVEYIRVLGENHWILDYEKRITWSNAISAWFDKWLKGRPEWWNDMYPPLDEEEKEQAPEKKEEPPVARHEGREVEMLKKSRPLKMRPVAVEMDRYGTVLFGEVTREDIARHMPGWNAEYFEYEPDHALRADLANNLEGVRIKAIIGTWCGDCRREIPRLWRILEGVGYSLSNVQMLAVASSSFTEDMGVPREALEWSRDVKSHYDVEAVATIVFLRGGVEIGRIVESPEIALEEDILRIVRD